MFIAPQHDIRPPWPLRQLAALVPHGGFEEVPGVAHNLWATDPRVWVDVITRACRVQIDASG
jgi:proline iminopeptidase